MWPFNSKCEHPFWALQTQKEQTVTVVDEDFEQIDYHFRCAKCREFITKSHSRTIGGVAAFMENGRQRMKGHNGKLTGAPPTQENEAMDDETDANGTSAACGASGLSVELGGGDDILTRLLLAQCGSCSCMTKTPEPQYHATYCATRVLQEAAEEITALRAKAARWDAIEILMVIGDVELTQAEDGGYSIYVEPVENILPKSWDGDTPDQAADKVAYALTTPNGTELTGAL